MKNKITQFIITITIFLTTLLITHHITTKFPTTIAKVHIPDELDDVVDNEEDDDWINWGKKKPDPKPEFDLKPSDLDTMEYSQIQDVMMKHHTGPVFGFVKLTLGVHWSPDKVSETAMKWSKVAKTGGLEVKFMGVDISTVMFTMEAGQDMDELKEFILEQPDAYEVKIGDNVYRRPGDPPLDEVIEKLQSEREKQHGQDEL